jgi:hypothetical protein
MASVITSDLFKEGQRLICQKSACSSNRNTMRSLNIAIVDVSSGLVCWAQRILREGRSRYSWPISTFQTKFSVLVGWWWDWKDVEHICEVKCSLVMPIETYRLCLFLNCFPPRFAWPFRWKPSHVPAIPMHIIIVIDAMASTFALPEVNRCSPLAIWSWMRLLNSILSCFPFSSGCRSRS